MSAKAFRHSPEFPLEVWSTVLRHATWDPKFPFPSECTFESIGSPKYTTEGLKRFRKTLITKRSIVRVCQAWYTLGCPFLYEHILLGRNRVLAPLRDGLSRAVRENRKVGWWTESLDVRMRDATNDPEAVFATLADILTYLPNLCILTFKILGHGFLPLPLPNVVLTSITSSGSLKCVQWFNCVAPPLAHHWTAFLNKHPEIEVLDAVQSVTVYTRLKLDAVKIVHGCPKRRVERIFIRWPVPDLPCIRSMFYDMTYASTFDDNITFTRLGQNLTDIQLDFLQGRYLRMPSVDFVLAQIRTECTRLTQVVLAVDSWSLIPGSYIPTLPSTVHTLGLRVMAEQLPATKVKQLFNTSFPSYIGNTPSIKTIKFMDAKNIRTLSSHPIALWHGLRVMEKMEVAILDSEYCPIVAPSCPGVVRLEERLGKPSSTSILDGQQLPS